MTKMVFRDRCLAKRRDLDPGQYRSLSEQVQQSLIDADLFQSAGCLALYSPVRNEVETAQLFAAAQSLGKRVFYPRVVQKDVRFFEVNALEGLVPGTFKVREPSPTCCVEAGLEELDLVVMPGVAFDLTGMRLGYGLGFYDRFLAQASDKLVTVGLCFELQIVDRLPKEDHDVCVDFLVTENRFLPCGTHPAGST